MNCALCGRHLNRFDIGKYKTTLPNGSEHPICKDCKQKEIRKGVKKILVDRGGERADR